MKKFLSALFFLVIASHCISQVQHVKGEILVQLRNAISAEAIEQSVYNQAGMIPNFKVKQLVSKPMNFYSEGTKAVTMKIPNLILNDIGTI